MSRPQITRSERSLRLIAIVAICLMIGSYLLLLGRSNQDFITRPTTEDAYYALSVSRSLGNGTGFSVDGVAPTNGVQPLICVVYAPIFAAVGPENPYLALRFVLLFGVLVAIIGAYVFGLLVAHLADSDSGTGAQARRKTTTIVAAGLYLVNYSLGTHLLNGLETGILLALISGASLYAWREGGSNIGVRSSIVLGLLLGLTILARIDAGFFAAVVVVLVLSGRWGPKRQESQPFRRRVLAVSIMTVVATALTLPWWLYGINEFGSPIPISGLSQQDLGSGPWSSLAETLSVSLDSLLPGLHSAASWRLGGVAPLGLLIVGLVLGWLVLRRKATRRYPATTAPSIGPLLPIAASVGLLVIIYTTLFHAPHFQPRYLILLRVLGVAAYALIAVRVLLSPQRGRSTLLRRFLPWTVLIAVFALNVVLTARLHRGDYPNTLIPTMQWIDENTRPSETIGVFQSGTLGYFYPDQVVNLDGKVNAAAYRSWTQGSLGDYVLSQRFSYVTDWPMYLERLSDSYAITEEFEAIDTLDNAFVVLKPRP